MLEEGQNQAGASAGYGHVENRQYYPKGFNVEMKQSVVLTEYGQLAKELCGLEELVGELRLKLEPVLGVDASYDTEAVKNLEVPVSISPLGESIRSDAAKARYIGQALRQLIWRIEV